VKQEIDLMRRNRLGDLLRKNARKYSDNVALTCYVEGDTEGVRVTYRELNAAANRFANALSELGLQKGDVGAIMCHNCVQYIIAEWGFLKANITATYINVNLISHEIAYQVNHSDAKILFVEDSLVDLITTVQDELKQVEIYGVINLKNTTSPAGWIQVEDLYSETYSAEEPEVDISDDDIAFRMYTSGTTAFPKAIDLTYSNAEYIARSYAQINGGEDMVNKPFGYFLPLYHSGSLHIFAHHCNGSHIVLASISNLLETLDIIEKEKVEGAGFPVVIFARLAQDPMLMEKMRSVTKLWWFGSAMPLDVLKKWLDFSPTLNVAAQWSQTECLIGTISWYNQEIGLPAAGNVIGKPYHDTEIKIVGEGDNEVPDGQPGEIVMRSPAIMKRFYKNKEATDEAFRNGWHHTGDVGMKGEDGYYYFVDRVKDMIKTGGVNVSAMEVEAALDGMPGIEGSAAFGVYHPDWAEAVVAAVKTSNKDLVEKDVIDYCKKNLAKFKVPKKVLFVDEIPLSHIGKVLRRNLRETYKDIFKKT